MVKYQCNACKRTFSRRENLDYHTENEACKTRCFQCEHCKKGFTSKNNMYRHMKHSCTEKNDQDKFEILNDKFEKLAKEHNKLAEENKFMKNKFVKLEKKPTTNTKNINNGTINNNDNRQVTNNITIVAYGKEDMSQIDREDIIRALKTGFNSTKQLTEAGHFNPKYPNYSNIKRSNFNMKNKVMYHNGNDWITTTNPHMIDDLYNQKRDFIEDYIDDNTDGLTQADMTRLQRWLNVEDNDRKITKIKDELRELLFNKKEVSETNEQKVGEARTDNKSDNKSIDMNIIEDIDDDNSCDTIILIKAKHNPNPTKRCIAPKNGRLRKAMVRRAK